MEKIKFDLSKNCGEFKMMNATNSGPWYKRHTTTLYRTNFADYKAARMPYSRNHDSALDGFYGGPYSHDITRIFPNFDADETNPESYDFACTDEAILCCLDAGTKTFFRLGQSIEHQIKKHGTIPPKDFNKWARICEHVIRHYTEGWADGFKLDMPYWEIWAEPDLDPDDSTNKRCWGGTKAQFFDFYEIAAKHLKKCFPHLKIGGPAICGRLTWADEFLGEMKKREVEIDFFSWHSYCEVPETMVKKSEAIHELLVKHGYENAENILDELNYKRRGGIEEFVYSVESIHGIKGAAFTMACIGEAQKSTIDMLMYYETRPSVFCGAFDFYTCRPLKGYYPLYWYGKFYDMDHEVRCENQPENIYTLCGVDKDGKVMCVVTNYSEDDNAPTKDIKIDFGKQGKYEIYKVSEEKDGELVETTNNLEFTLNRWEFVLIKEI